MTHHQTILLVEDNPADEELTLLAFEKSKIKNPVVVARDGEEALEYIFGQGKYADRDIKDKPPLIILDIKLPKVDGLEVLRAIRARAETKCIPVIILTSSKEEQDVVEAYDLGTNAYVRKPVDFNRFVEAASHLGMFWLVFNECPYC